LLNGQTVTYAVSTAVGNVKQDEFLANDFADSAALNPGWYGFIVNFHLTKPRQELLWNQVDFSRHGGNSTRAPFVSSTISLVFQSSIIANQVRVHTPVEGVDRSGYQQV
jgi:hypothetical protein